MASHPFNFGSGKVTWCSWDIDESLAFPQQMWPHERDLIQVNYPRSDTTLDISWMQKGERSRGAFLVMLFKGDSCDKPLVKRRPRSLKGLRAVVSQTAGKANAMEQRARTISNRERP